MSGKLKELQLMDRKRLMIGDSFGVPDIDVGNQFYLVEKEWQDISLTLITLSDHSTKVSGNQPDPRMLQLFSYNGGWQCWLDVTTGKCYSTPGQSKVSGRDIPEKVLLDITPPAEIQGLDNVQ